MGLPSHASPNAKKPYVFIIIQCTQINIYEQYQMPCLNYFTAQDQCITQFYWKKGKERNTGNAKDMGVPLDTGV